MAEPRPTLLLDAGYRPLRVISWQRAVGLWFLGKVEVLGSHEELIRGVSTALYAPSVVRLVRSGRVQPEGVRFCRKNVYLRDGHRCQYCGERFSAAELTLDHVVPKRLGGGTSWHNVVAACRPCNRKKGGSSPEAAGLRLRSVPRRPAWKTPMALRLWYENPPPLWRDWLG